MDAQRFRIGFDLEPFHSKLFNPRWPHSPEEHKVDTNVEIERLRLEILLLQPVPSPQDDLLPRRSPAVGTGLEEPGLPRTVKQSMERELIFPLQAILDGCTSPE